jgi:hypothetical protein
MRLLMERFLIALKIHDADCMSPIMQGSFESDIFTHCSRAYEGYSATNSTKCGLLLSTDNKHTSLTICRHRYDVRNGLTICYVKEHTCMQKFPTGSQKLTLFSVFRQTLGVRGPAIFPDYLVQNIGSDIHHIRIWSHDECWFRYSFTTLKGMFSEDWRCTFVPH